MQEITSSKKSLNSNQKYLEKLLTYVCVKEEEFQLYLKFIWDILVRMALSFIRTFSIFVQILKLETSKVTEWSASLLQGLNYQDPLRNSINFLVAISIPHSAKGRQLQNFRVLFSFLVWMDFDISICSSNALSLWIVPFSSLVCIPWYICCQQFVVPASKVILKSALRG